MVVINMKLFCSGISKNYGNQVLENVSFEVNSGILGLLGENGAGKTTLLEIIATLIKPTEGNVYYDNLEVGGNLYAIRQKIGYLPQKFDFFPNLTVEELLDYICYLKGIADKEKRIHEIEEKLQQVGLEEQRYKKFYKLSGGMKQRIGIAQAIIGNPRILLVDEPTVGLDPHERVAFRQLLSTLAKDRIIILSTHIVEDIATTSERVLVLQKGKINYFGDIVSFIQSVNGKVWVYRGENLPIEIKDNAIIISSQTIVNGVEVRYISDNPCIGSKQIDPTLEDAYIYINRKKAGR